MKKNFMNKRLIRDAALLTVGSLLVISCASTVPTTMDSVCAITKEEAEEQKKDAEENEQNAKDVLDSLEEQQNNVVKEVEELDAQVTDIQSQITAKTKESQKLQNTIENTQKELEQAQIAEDNQYEAMKERIQYLYEEGEVDYVDALLTSTTFSDMLNKSEYIDQLSIYDQQQLADLIQTRSDIAEYEETLESDLRQVESLKTDLKEYNNQLEEKIDEKEAQISQYDEDIDAQEALMAKFTAEREKLEKQIEEMSRQEAMKATSGGTSTYTTDGTVYDTSEYSGRFMWPVATGGVITSYFGYRNAPTAGASTYHQGLDIGCAYGSDIVAADEGTVIMSCYNGGGGNMVMISHDDGICTVYMHNSQLCVTVGEKVVKGQVIAKAGSTGVSTGPHCHFGVQINGTYVNPQDFL